METKMLLADKFDREMVTKYTGAKVKINIEKHGIEIEGVNSEVKDIQAEMEKRTNTYTKIQKTSPIKLEKIYKSTIVEEYIGHKFEQASVIAVWEADNGKLNVISKTGEMVDKAVAIVQTSVKMCSVQVKAEQKSIIETSKWKELVEQLSIKHHGKLIFDMSEESKIAMLSTVDIHNVVLEAINNFLDTNTKYVEMWHVKANTLQLLTQHHKHDVLQITMGTNVTLTEHKVCFEISGTKHDIESAKRKLDTIVAKIKAQPYSVSKPGISTLWKSQKGRDIQHVVETAHRVILKSTFDKRDDEDHTFDKGAMAGGHHLGCNVIASCTGQGKTMIQVILGDITDLDVDVIIYSANELLDLNSGLGKAILAKGGQSIAHECKQYINTHKKLDEGEVFLSKAGKLKAKYIVHVASPKWKNDKDDSKLMNVVTKAMKLTSGNNHKSLAIPALSCGTYRYPVDRATCAIVAAANNFFREMSHSDLTSIYLCDITENTVYGFIKALEREFGVPNVRRHNRPNIFADPTIPVNTPGNNTSTLLGNICVSMKKDVLAEQTIAVLVNTIATNLDLNAGAVSKTILKQAGPEIQQELKQKYLNGISCGEIAVTKGHKLKCTHVIHGAVAKWDGQQKTRNDLRRLVTRCLEETQKLGHDGVAIPAIGTGALEYPKNVAATEMFTAISEFATNYPHSSINRVEIVLYPKDFDTIKAFEVEFEKRLIVSQQNRDRDVDSFETTKTKDGDDEHIYEEISALTSRELKHVFVIGNIMVTIKEGDITKEDADCIVNSSNDNLDLKLGQVSTALVNLCGPNLVEEAKAKKEEMKRTGLAITKAPGLRCKFIMHVVVKVDERKQVVGQCLRKAKTENIRSIAFPALGTGLNFRVDDIAQAMCMAFDDFKNEGCGSLTDIRFVIIKPEMVDKFCQAAKRANWVQSGLPKKPTFDAVGTQSRDLTGDTIHLQLYALDDSDIRNAIKQLERMIQGECTSFTFTDPIVKRLNETQMQAIGKVVKNNQVDLKHSNGQPEIYGLLTNVHTASIQINRIIKDAIQIESEQKLALMCKALVQWCFIEVVDNDDVYRPFEDQLNFKIEQSYTNTEDTFTYLRSGLEIVIDFKTLHRYEKGEKDENKKTRIVRKDLIEEQQIETPKEWEQSKGNCYLKTLHITDPKYEELESRFKQTSGLGWMVVKIQEVQNKALWRQYGARKRQLEEQNPSGTTNERLLWHGTTESTVDSVNLHGFNRSYCGLNATFYGDGVYFAIEASYSASDIYSKPDANGVKRMYNCKVLTGEYAKGERGMRVPPAKPSGGKNALYDSVTNDLQKPTMFIIFNDTQAYPLFIVHFKKQT